MKYLDSLTKVRKFTLVYVFSASAVMSMALRRSPVQPEIHSGTRTARGFVG